MKPLLMTAVLLALQAGPSTDTAKAEDTSFDCRAIEFIVGFGAGGGTDLFARAIQPGMEEELGVPVQVLNIPGGSGTIAFAEVMNRPADGCTVFAINTDYVLLEVTGASDLSLLDLSPLVRAHVDIGLLNAGVEGAQTFQSLLSQSREEGRDLLIGGVGSGSFDEGAVAILMAQANVNYRYIPYDGAQEMHADLLGKRLDLVYDEVGVMLPMTQAGQVKPLLVAFDQRIEALPDVPTASELGLGTSPPIWRGIGVREETPDMLKQAIASAVEAALDGDAYRAFEASRSLDIAQGRAGPDLFRSIVAAEIESFSNSLGN